MNKDIKYFLFSKEQMSMKKTIAKKIGKEYMPGIVFLGTSRKQFTDIVSDPSKSKFSDSIIITYGDISTIKYKPGSD